MSEARIKQLYHTIKVAILAFPFFNVYLSSYRTAPLWRDQLRSKASLIKTSSATLRLMGTMQR